jgi:uncharacterized membrane protein
MRRLYFVAPDVASAQRLVDTLLLARVEERHIHVLAQEGVPMEDLPTASVMQTTDLAQGIEKGLAFGGASGVVAGLVAITFPPAGLVLGGGAVILATALAGAGVGALAGSLVALNVPNTHLREFEEALTQGRLVIMVDVPRERVDPICASLRTKHPEVVHTGRSEHGAQPVAHIPE